MSEVAIGDYGFLADGHTGALIGREGSIDWYCPSRFDTPSVFARLLDPEGGHWSIRPVQATVVEREYLDGTMVLRTAFHETRGQAAMTDALALAPGVRGHDIGSQSPQTLLRRVEGLDGEVEFVMELDPRPGYATDPPEIEALTDGALIRGGPVELHLTASVPLQIVGSRIGAQFTVHAGEAVEFALAYRDRSLTDDHEQASPGVSVAAALEDAVEAWRSWSEMHRTYDGPYADQVHRSALVLRALTYQPTGGVVAAATTSVPETPGGSDTWDYRYVWLRDLSLTLRALWIAACPHEAEQFFHWMDGAISPRLTEGRHVQIMYGLNGEWDLAESTLAHLQGYRGSQPVRIGNGAWDQKQLDVLGEVIDAVYLFRDRLGELDDRTQRLVCVLADAAAETWTEPDAGIWEAREGDRHHLSSKVLCWVALDRAVKLADKLGDGANVRSWEAARDDVRRTVLERGWSERAGAYTGSFDSDELDASVLLLPLVGFLPADEPRMWATIEAVRRELARDGLVHRWAAERNGFLICTYWLVECLALAGDVKGAVELFERTTGYAGELGLLSEEVDAVSGEMWGNFPQAFSHVGLVNAASAIGDAQRSRGVLARARRVAHRLTGL